MGYTNYRVSFVKRLVGPAHGVGGVDPITRLKAVAVNLNFQYGLLLTEYAIEHRVQMQPRIINVIPSPVKQLVSPAPVQVVGRKHGSAAAEGMEEGEDEEDRHFHQVRMTDSAGLSFVVSKNTFHLVGANRSIFMRTLIPKEDRQRMFRMAFAHGVLHHLGSGRGTATADASSDWWPECYPEQERLLLGADSGLEVLVSPNTVGGGWIQQCGGAALVFGTLPKSELPFSDHNV